ncbi:DsbA family protein [Loktanella sp. Alg231-35]|uniref:DsbA family protein n=1 Tax=Loktanella sp. Alg231-35 TaxID=1922220 RepID=UPI000D551909|nr:DsbA family protein [Loktanella sp. Alg231-35]
MRRFITAAALALLPFGAMAQDLTEEQIKQLALEAILENPQVIMEAVAILEQRRNAAQAAAQADVLQEQRALLENDPNAPVIGNPDAEAVIVEFFDYNCPYCKRAAADVKALLAQDGDIKVVYREWPILGEGSVFASRAALAARAQGKYEELHWALMELRGRATEASVLAAAREVGIDTDQLVVDMEAPDVAAHIETTQALAQGLGFTGTPAYVIGNALVPGAVPLADLQGYVADARQAE